MGEKNCGRLAGSVRTGHGDDDDGIVGHLDEGVERVLEDHARVVAERRPDADEVHGHQQRRQRHKAEDALPADGLQRRHVVLRHKLLLPHLRRINIKHHLQ